MNDILDPQAITQSASDKFLEGVAQSLDIPDSYKEAAIKKYNSVGEWLQRPQSCLFDFKPEIYPQGSFRLGTVVKPENDKDDYDIDLVCLVDIGKRSITQERLKVNRPGFVGGSIS